jgi:putative endonuclease
MIGAQAYYRNCGFPAPLLVLRYNVVMYSVYVLQHTETKQHYIGRTNNLRQRLEQHNASQTKSTHRTSGEWILIYAEAYRSKEDAVKREARLKQHGRAKQEVLRRAELSQII